MRPERSVLSHARSVKALDRHRDGETQPPLNNSADGTGVGFRAATKDETDGSEDSFRPVSGNRQVEADGVVVRQRRHAALAKLVQDDWTRRR